MVAVSKKEPKEFKKGVRRLLRYLAIARSSDYVVAHWMLNSKNLIKLTEPLEKFLGQEEEKDKKEVSAAVEKIAQETKGKTLKERRGKLERANEILKI